MSSLKSQIKQLDYEQWPRSMKLQAFQERLTAAEENQAAYPSMLMKCHIELLELEIYKLEYNMIVQRKVDFDGDGGITGTYWQDVHLGSLDGSDLEQALGELNDPEGTEYRIIHDKCGSAFVTQPPPPLKGIRFGDNST